MGTEKNKESQLTAEYLRSQLYYDPVTGEFWRIVDKFGRNIYEKAGGVKGDCYRRIGLRVGGTNYRYRAHRLAWLYVHGVWPKTHIDHIDRDGLNNRISNLREATHKENLRNSRKQANCSSRYVGVCLLKKTGKWFASIFLNGRHRSLGRFDTEEEAALAYNKAALERDPNFNNLNVVIQPKSA